MEQDADNGDTIEVRFVTSLDEKYRVTPAPFRVPVRLARFGLSGVINHLLSLDPPKPFDFLIENEFVRTSLEQYLSDKALSRETTLTIEYVEAFAPPQHDKQFKHDDWVSCLDASANDLCVTGSYDKIVRVWGADGKVRATCSGHSKPVKSVAVAPGAKADAVQIVSASQDQTLRVWQVDPSAGTAHTTHIAKGHGGSADAVSVRPSEAGPLRFCSGSWDHSVKIWEASPEAVELAGSKKKRKLDKPEPKTLSPLSSLAGHTQCVSSVTWSTPGEVISGSWDHSLRFWDVETGNATNTMNGAKVIYSVTYSPLSRVVATGHADRTIRIWDPRSHGGSLVAQQLTSHANWVTGVAWHPTVEHLLVSCSHDKSVKMWDVRAKIPLHTATEHTDKVLCVGWDRNDRVYSGGADTKLNVWRTSASQQRR